MGIEKILTVFTLRNIQILDILIIKIKKNMKIVRFFVEQIT